MGIRGPSMQRVLSFQGRVRGDDRLYLRTIHPGTCKVEPEEHYDLATDPNMAGELMKSRPEQAEPLNAVSADRKLKYAGYPGGAPDPLQTKAARGPVPHCDPER